MSGSGPRLGSLSIAAVLALSSLACGRGDPAPPSARLTEGETCQVSTQCAAGLRCLDGVCTTGACQQASECLGEVPDMCAAWTCIAGRCVAACYPDGGAGIDAAPRDAQVRPDATAQPDGGVVDTGVAGMDATVVEDTGVVGMDATVVEDTGIVVDTGVAADSGVANPDAMVVADSGVLAPDAMPRPDAGCDTTPRAPAAGDLLLNELLADPAEDVANGDANRDGTRDQFADEFVEIANVSSQTLQLAGVVVSDSAALRHRFAARTLDCGQVVVVFGGGSPAGANWQPNWVAASSGNLQLNNNGDTVRVGTSTAAPANLVSEMYGANGGNNQSLVRTTELTPGSPFILHNAHPQAGGRVHSPGVRVDGTAF